MSVIDMQSLSETKADWAPPMLRVAMERAGLNSIYALAKKMGVRGSAIRQIYTRNTCTLDVAIRLLSALGLDDSPRLALEILKELQSVNGLTRTQPSTKLSNIADEAAQKSAEQLANGYLYVFKEYNTLHAA